MGNAVEASSQRIRHHLRRPIPGRGELLTENARNTVNEIVPTVKLRVEQVKLGGRVSATRLRACLGRIPWFKQVVLKVLNSSRPKYQEKSGIVGPIGPFLLLLTRHEGRRTQKWVHYGEIYDEVFSRFLPETELNGDGKGKPLPGRPIRLLEIGVADGGSLEVWRQYLGLDAVIFGIDNDPRCNSVNGDSLNVRIGSQGDKAFLESVVAEMGGVDIVVDDGSHIARLQRKSFDVLFPLMGDGGLYVIEDTHTSYLLEYGGGYRRPGTIIQVAKSMVDGLNRAHFRSPVGKRAEMAFRDVHSIQFFNSVIAIRKGRRLEPQDLIFGAKIN